MTDTQSVRYQPIPNNKLASRLLTNWSAGDIIVLLLGLLAVTASALASDLFWIIFSSTTMVTMLVRTRTGYGRIYYEIWVELVGYFIDIALNGILWQAKEETQPLVRFLRGRWRAIPMRLTQVNAVIDGQTERFGLLEQLDRPYDNLYIAADGGSFADLDINADSDAVSTMANVMNIAILETELKAGTSYLRIESPYDHAQVAAEVSRVIDPVIARPESFELDERALKWVEWARKNLNQLRPLMRKERVTKSHYLIVVSIKRKRSVYRKDRSFTDNQLRDLPIIELGRALVEALSNESSLGLENIHCLGLAELAGVVRSSWDIAGIDKYNLDKAAGLIPRTDNEIEEFLRTYEWKGVEPRNDKELQHFVNYEGGLGKLDQRLQAWPTQIVRVSTKDKILQMDDNYLSTLRATSLPEQIRSDQARNLQYIAPRPGTWLRRATVGESASGTTETNQLVIAESAAANWQSFRTGKQIVQHPKFAKRRKDLAQQAQVSSSQSVLQRFNYFWTIGGTNLEDVIRARKASRGRLQTEQFASKLIAPTALQVNGYICGCLGINRL